MIILEESNSAYTYRAYVTKFMPTDSEKFERVDEIPNDGNVPKAEYNDCHCYNLGEK